MPFTKSDRSEVESLLSKVTTTVDAVGRSKRDIGLVLRTNTHWPDSVASALGAYQAGLYQVLISMDGLEMAVVRAINAEFPSG